MTPTDKRGFITSRIFRACPSACRLPPVIMGRAWFMDVVGLPGNGWRMACSMFLTTTSTRCA